MIMGCILGCREAGLAMAAGMSAGRSPLFRIESNPRNQEDSIEDLKRRIVLEERENLFKSVGNSDHAMLAAAYLNWDAIQSGAGDQRKYCERLGLSFKGMQDVRQLVKQLDSSLSSLGYFSSDDADRNAKSWRIIRACATAALAPSQLVRVQRPVAKYAETSEGAVEKDGVAKELKFYIRVKSTGDNQPVATEERVFMHPSSTNFSVGSYNCPWLVYHELVRTSKAFLRDATECSAYSLLLFGGKLEVQASKGLIIIDDWVRLAANARIGALVGGLRREVDELLSRKVEDPAFNIAATVEMKLIVNLLVSDGLGH
jgi:ATP-dependent RNA helicase DHX57